MAEQYEGKREDNSRGNDNKGTGGRPYSERPATNDRQPARPYNERGGQSGRPYGDRSARSNDRPSYGDRDNRGGQADRPARSNDRPSYGDRDNRGADRPMVNGRREDRKPFGDRDNRGGQGGRPTGDRDSRPSYGDRPARSGGDRPYGNRDDRPARSNDRPSYGDRDNRGGQGGRPTGDRDSRPSYGDRPARSGGDRPYGNRDDRPARSNDRPSYGDRDNRGGQGGRPTGDRDSRPSYGNRDDRPARSNDRPSYGDRPARSGGDRPARSGGDRPYGNRDDRPARSNDRPSYGDRDNRGGQGGRPTGDRDSRPSYGNRDDRPARSNDRPSYGDRPARSGGDRPYGNRDDRPGRSNDRPSYGDRDNRGGQGGRPTGDRDSRPSYGDRPARSGGDRPSYGNRDDRPARSNDRPSYGDREDRGPRVAPERNASDLRSSNRPDRDRSPHIDADVTGEELDKVTRAQLRILDSRNNEWVSKHLVMAGRLIDFVPELAFEHALAASRRGGRLACVREAVAMTAYAAGKYGEALRELRTFRRISGSNVHLPLMADCERGLGRPDRAIDLIKSEDAETLDTAGKVELAIVESGARGDLGEMEAALSALEIPQLDLNRAFSFSPRLFRAYGMVLRSVGRKDEAKTWERQALVAEEALGIDEGFDQIIMDLGDDEEIPLDSPRARVRVADVMAPATPPVMDDAAKAESAELTDGEADVEQQDEPNVDDAESSYFESDDAESDADSAEEDEFNAAEGEDSDERSSDS
ncbi:hypothetical protein [Specibacter sp. NPDC078692]|uniref:hypothetical protein n=1 Tax=Specibacter sp. NPDC078692 TaxID=3155818 RepID=UPI003423AB02